LKKIKVISLGGTISALGKDRLDLKDYVSGKLSGEEILEAIPEIKSLAELSFSQLDNVSSTAIQTSHWLALREIIHNSLQDEDYDGIVITHGTNTLEETAYFLHLTVDTSKPIVLTGAQRPFSAISSDVFINLLHAVQVASAEESAGKGVLVLLNGQITSARDVTKSNTYALGAFQARELGCLGFIQADGKVSYYQEPLRKHTNSSHLRKVNMSGIKDIAIVYSHAGARGDIIHYIAQDENYAGIVMAGTGAGRFSKEEDLALAKAEEKGLFIVRSSRVGSGEVVYIDHYAFLDAITADNLSPQKARILLMLALQTTKDKKEIQELFDTH